jgi:hypothetical protein
MPSDPLWMNCPSPGAPPQYTAAELRQAMALAAVYGGRNLGGRQGVRPGGTQWGVTLSGSTITVDTGVGLVDPGLTTGQGPYWMPLPATETQTLAAAHATLPRKDIIVIAIHDTDEDASGLRTGRSEYIQGTASATPTEPAVPAGSVKIATIDVPASGGGSAVVTQNAPYTVSPGGVLPVRNAAEVAAVVAAPGMLLFRLDTLELLAWTGAAFQAPLLGIANAADRGQKLQSGVFGITTTSGQNQASATLTFPTPFATIPKIVAIMDTVQLAAVAVQSRTVSSCVLRTWRTDGSTWPAGTANAVWIAVG